MFALRAFLGVLKAVAVAVGLDDVDAARDAVEERSGHAFVAQYLGPVLEGQVGCEQNALAFIGAADDLKQQFSADLGRRDVSELIENEQVEFGHPVEETFELAFFAGLDQLGDEVGEGKEADALRLV